MATAFAALETRVNAAVVARLANAVADFGAGVTVEGLFDQPYAEAFDLITGSKPSFRALAAALPAITIGVTTVEISTVAVVGTYTISESQPDGAGMVTLILEVV